MGKNKVTLLLTFLFFVLLSCASFWQTFVLHTFPYPGNFMLAWFEPWKTDFMSNGIITIAHKAIADDIFKQLYPFRILGVDMMKQFMLPLWNPYNGAGMPLLATMNIGFLDPFNILYFFLPNYVAWSAYIIIQPLLIGFFSFLYFRKIKLSLAASLFGACVFLFSGVVTVRLIYGIFGMSYAMLPFMLYLFENYLADEKSKKIWLLPIALFLTIISTQPQISLYSISFVISYIVFRNYQSGFPLKRYIFIACLFVLGCGLAAIQLVPTAELFKYSNINLASSQFIFERFLVAPSHFLTVFIPNYFGNIGTYNFWEPNVDYVETIAYMGLIPIFFACIWMLQKKKHDGNLSYFLLGVIAICICLTVKWPVSELFFKLPLPVISTGIPTRIFLLSSFAITILAAFGFDTLYKNYFSYKKFLLESLPVLVLIAGIGGFSLMAVLRHFPCPAINLECHIVSLRNTFLEIIAFDACFITLLAYLAAQRNVLFKRIAQGTVIVILITIGLYNSQKYQPFSSTMSFMPAHPLINALHIGTGRVFGFDEATIDKNFATFFRFYDPQYYHPLYIQRYGELVSFANTGIYPPPLLRSDVNIINSATVSADIQQRRKRLFDLLGVRDFIYKKTQNQDSQNVVWEDANWKLISNPTALPRAYFVDNVIVEKSDKKILEKLFSGQFNPQKTAILEDIPHIGLPQTHNNSSVKITGYKENTVKLLATTNQPAFLILSDNYYPGWKAFLDGKEIPVFRTDYTFRGVIVPNGKHIVEFRYQPLSFLVGVIISGVSLLLLAFFYFRKSFLS